MPLGDRGAPEGTDGIKVTLRGRGRGSEGMEDRSKSERVSVDHIAYKMEGSLTSRTEGA